MLVYMEPKDLWRKITICHVAFLSTLMPTPISYNLHMGDPAEDAVDDQKKSTDQFDHLLRVKPPYEKIRNGCLVTFHPGWSPQRKSCDKAVREGQANEVGDQTDVKCYTCDFRISFV